MTDISTTQTTVRINPRFLLAVIELTLIVALAPLVIPPLLSIQLPSYTSLSGFITAGVVPAIINIFFPKPLQSKLLVWVQHTLSSRKTLVILNVALVTLLIGSCVTKYTFKWAGLSKFTVYVNGRKTTLTGYENDDGFFVANYFRVLPFFPVTFQSGTWSATDTPVPFQTVKFMDVPPFATLRYIQSYAEAEKYLLETLFESPEITDLRLKNAKRLISEVPASPAYVPAQKRLHTILTILSTVADPTTDSTLQDNTSSEMELLKNEPYSKDDPWVWLLTTDIDLKDGRYAECSADITDEELAKIDAAGSREANDNDRRTFEPGTFYAMESTTYFLKGFCRLNEGQDAEDKVAGNDTNHAVNVASNSLDSSRTLFEDSYAPKLMTGIPDARFTNLAKASSQLFEGVSFFYEGNIQRSIEYFTEISSEAPPPIRARALNAAGFASFMDGETWVANTEFDKALEISDGFPKAEVNYGFSLISDDKIYVHAGPRFNAAVSGGDVPSLYDRSLAYLGEAHLFELQKSPRNAKDLSAKDLQVVVDRYDNLNRMMGKKTVDKEGLDLGIRYAFLAKDLTKSVYLPPHSFGNEVLALAFLCRAKEILGARPSGDLDRYQSAQYVYIRDFLDSETASLLGVLKIHWKHYPKTGWFSSIEACGKPQQDAASR